MKKTLKKALIVMAVIAVAMLMMAFAASAAYDCGSPDEHNLVTTYYAPTCTTPGYTETSCTLCDFKNVSGSPEPALGHSVAGVQPKYYLVEDKENGDYYKKGVTCKRAECRQTIYDTHADENNIQVYDRYYLVELINPWGVDEYWENITYTRVVKTHKDLNCGKWYVKEGTLLEDYLTDPERGYVNYTDWMNQIKKATAAMRLKDKAYGAYELVGWSYDILDSDEYINDDIINFRNPEQAKITENTVIYAVFKGDPSITYSVQYRNANYDIYTASFEVRHGDAADDSIFLPEYDENGNFVKYHNDRLQLPENIKSYYVYTGWTPSREEIYGSTTILATYETIAKKYDFVFYKWDSKKGEYVDSGVRARAEYGTALVYVDANGKELTNAELKALTAKEKDRSYVYSWDGNWEIYQRGTTVLGNSCSVAYDALDTRYEGTDGYAPTILIPTYTKRQNLYQTTVTIKFDQSVDFSGTGKAYETETYLNGLNVQITDANGQIMATGVANLVAGTDYAEFKCSLYDSQSYTVTVSSYRNKYSGSTTLSRTHVFDVERPVYISVGLTVNQDYVDGLGCGCICHNTLFKSLWVRVLNLLYRLFNVRYVCCDDMYASIGDLLAYTK